jgi:hypothetical protein
LTKSLDAHEMQKSAAAEPKRRISKLNKSIAMMIAGAIMLVVGTVVSAYLGSVFVHDYTSAAHPYPGYGIISPLDTQIASIFIAITGLGLIVWGLGGTQWAKP